MPLIVESNREYPADGDGRGVGEGDGDAEAGAVGPTAGCRTMASPTRLMAATATTATPSLAKVDGMIRTLGGRPNTVRRCGVTSTEAKSRSKTQAGARGEAWAA
jgi:hypothetical protein